MPSQISPNDLTCPNPKGSKSEDTSSPNIPHSTPLSRGAHSNTQNLPTGVIREEVLPTSLTRTPSVQPLTSQLIEDQNVQFTLNEYGRKISPQWLVEEIKPLFRGWLHTIMTPIVLIGGIISCILAPTAGLLVACVIYTLCSLILFGNSALYHRVKWSPRGHYIMRRLDHSNIFLLIAGTYTPPAAALLPKIDAAILLGVVWGGAIIGIAFNLLWPKAPRQTYVILYVILGWTALWYLPALWQHGGALIILLIAGGGLAYTIGAVVFAFGRPNPSPKYFGYHEIFHTGTVVGWGLQFAAVIIILLRVS